MKCNTCSSVQIKWWYPKFHVKRLCIKKLQVCLLWLYSENMAMVIFLTAFKCIILQLMWRVENVFLTVTSMYGFWSEVLSVSWAHQPNMLGFLSEVFVLRVNGYTFNWHWRAAPRNSEASSLTVKAWLKYKSDGKHFIKMSSSNWIVIQILCRLKVRGWYFCLSTLTYENLYKVIVSVFAIHKERYWLTPWTAIASTS